MTSRKRHPSDPAPGFPLRVGVVDMGSNAIRLVAAEFIAPATFTELLVDRVPIRLGHDVYQTGRLDEDAMERAVRTMVRFREVLEELGIPHYRAVATSAVRESENAGALAQRIRRETGLELEIITGVEEARLVVWALRHRLDLGDDPWVLADLGGGSLELALFDASSLQSAESHTIGSVRLHEEFQDVSGDLPRFRKLLNEYLDALRIPAIEKRAGRAGFVATGGNMEDLAQLAGVPKDGHGVSVVGLGALEDVIERLAELSYEERIDRLGLREDRADVILPAALVYARLAHLIGVNEIHVPHVGVKEGVMFDMVDDLMTHTGYTERHRREVLSGAVALGRRFGFDEPHGVHVGRLAESLFDQLAPLHGLDSESREILLAAAVLHDIGQSISYPKHHKHSHYLVSQSELPGFGPEEIPLIAAVARYHRKAHPSEKHAEFAVLDEGDRDLVTRLASILRIADALDREHQEKVETVTVSIEDDTVWLALDGPGDLALERWAVARKADLFETTFGRQVRTSDEMEPEEDEDDDD